MDKGKKSGLKISTLKKYAQSYYLERFENPGQSDDGEAIFMHSITCCGYCDYGCNEPKGHRIAEDINIIEGQG